MPEATFKPGTVQVPGKDMWVSGNPPVTLDGGYYECEMFVPDDALTFRLYAVFWSKKEHGPEERQSGVEVIADPAGGSHWQVVGARYWRETDTAFLFTWFNGEYIPLTNRTRDHEFDDASLEFDETRDATPHRGTTITWRVKPFNHWARQTNFRAMMHLVS